MGSQIDTYESPYSNRYGTQELRYVWSIEHTRYLWHLYWLNQLRILHDVGMEIDLEIIDRIKASNTLELDLVHRCYYLALKYEKTTHHDLAAHLQAFEETLPKNVRGLVHLGLTSSDVEDAAAGIQIMESLVILGRGLSDMLTLLDASVRKWSNFVVLGRTHLQFAEPTTLGYRMLVYLEQLQRPTWALLKVLDDGFASKPHPGATGTGANWYMVTGGVPTPLTLQHLRPLQAAGQTYPRTEELAVGHILSDMAATLHKMALDMRIMHMEPWVNKYGTDGQVGSSAMPGKVNPIGWEKITSLARLVESMSHNLWDVAGNSALERTLDDSASRRSILPEMFLAMQECLITACHNLGEVDNHLDMGAALMQVEENWRSWVPSRALTWLSTLDPSTSHSYHAQVIQTVLSLSTDYNDFWHRLGVATPQTTYELLHLNHIIDTCNQFDVVRSLDFAISLITPWSMG